MAAVRRTEVRALLSRYGVLFGAPVVLAALSVFFPGGRAQSAPFEPRDSDVVERFPAPASDPELRDLAALRERLGRTPDDVALAARTAEKLVELARRHSDPRFLGQAEAILAPFSSSSVPSEVLLLKATLSQSQHRFEQSLALLDRVLAAERSNPQAWLTRAVVLTVLGRGIEALGSCEEIRSRATDLVYRSCRGAALSASGGAALARDELRAALARQNDDPMSVRGYAQSVLGEAFVRLGRFEDAERAFQDALRSSPGDSYTLGAYADVLLQRGASGEVETLLAEYTAVDTLLLRLAIAATRGGRAHASDLVDDLGARIEAIRRRGDTAHLREEARFELALRNDPSRALALAIKNFEVQREPVDVRLVIEAALEANDPSAAKAAISFVRTSGLDDAVISRLCAEARRRGLR
jgi:tetratricopeptide (TPR) repeat protein